MKRTSTIVGIVFITVGVILLVTLSLLWGLGTWGPGSGSSADSPDGFTTSVERHFLEQMIPHHEDAVAMAELALTRAEHPELKQLAETIIRDQTREIDQMSSWYKAWYGIEAPEGGDMRGSGRPEAAGG